MLCDLSVSVSPCVASVFVCLFVYLGVVVVRVASLVSCVGVCSEVSVSETSNGLGPGPSDAWERGPSLSCYRIKQLQFCKEDLGFA